MAVTLRYNILRPANGESMFCRLLILQGLLAVTVVHPVAAQKVSFEKQILPIFRKHCVRCHGEKQEAELDLRTAAGVLRGGESGKIIHFAEPSNSPLIKVVSSGAMPPEDEPPLSPEDRALISRWIQSGTDLPRDPVTVELSQHDVLPILQLRCTVCHGRSRKEAGLDLRTRDSILKGGKSGPAMVLGDPDASLLLNQIHKGAMPPKAQLASVSVKPARPEEIQTITDWISAGAPVREINPDVATLKPDPLVSDNDREFWAFRSPQLPNVPHSSFSNPVDAFVDARLRENGLQHSPLADRVTLIRRATFDLHGLLPTPEEVEEFVSDQRADAWQRLIDRLLESPRYGERWGRHWLDVAGYSDSEGGQHADKLRPEAWRYRDYVIRAFNSDKPYDRFLMEQIAGDELTDFRRAPQITPEIYDNLVATGFLRLAPDGTYVGITGFVPDRLEIIDDELEVLSSAVMGLTIRCARCHSHKFDPLPQRDYYRLAAVFKGALDENDWLDPQSQRFLSQVTSEEQTAWKAHEDGITAEVSQTQKRLTDEERRLAKKYGQDEPNRDALKELEPEFAALVSQTAERVKSLNGKRKPEPRIRALWDRGEPTQTYLLKRGHYLTRGRPIGPGVPSVLTDGQTPFEVKPPFEGTTGRRLAFAKWLVDPGHPLTARVMVNRIWKHHFGYGIVRSLENFGTTGTPPTHPRLLDWLAVQFAQGGWSVKDMHRLLMTSRTWMQASTASDALLRADPENRLLARMPLQRMEGEVLRDSLLQISGQLDPTPFGPADQVDAREDGLVLARGTDRGWRRTVYVLQRRTTRLTILDNFDLPQLNPNCVERTESVVAPQALHLLNNRRIHELSSRFADRVVSLAGDDPHRQTKILWRLATGRRPDRHEHQHLLDSMRKLSAEWQQQLSAREVKLPAATQLWIRASEPDRVWENDLISVWSSAKELRYGLVEFDVSGQSVAEWKSARLELGVLGNGGEIRQTARLIAPGIADYTWNRFQATKAKQQTFDLFGVIRATSGEGASGMLARSADASRKDLRVLKDAAGRSDRLTFVLIADEDGTVLGRDWDDGSKHHQPQLVIGLGAPSQQQANRRALQNLCHAVMNSAAFLYID